MSKKSTLTKFREFLSKDYRDQLRKRDKLIKMLRRMREKQHGLEAERALESHPDALELLDMQIRLLREQRRKGIELLRDMRKARHQESADRSGGKV